MRGSTACGGDGNPRPDDAIRTETKRDSARPERPAAPENNMAVKATQADESQEPSSETTDGPLLDLSDAAVKRMIKLAKKRGYVTYEELNEVLPSEEVTSEQIEDTMSMLSDMGINVIEEEEAEEAAGDGASGTDLVEAAPTAVAKTTTKEPTDRTDDPVRMYLREMGSVELLSREGEIAIAKRIEAGREAMIAGLCESPLTFQAIIIWRDELNEGKVLLRDIIDLEATYSGPDFKPEGAEDETDGDGEEGGEAASGSQAGVSGGGRPAPAARTWYARPRCVPRPGACPCRERKRRRTRGASRPTAPSYHPARRARRRRRRCGTARGQRPSP